MPSSNLEMASAVILLILGLLFLIYIPPSPSNVASDAIFLGAGVLLFRKALSDRKKEKIPPPVPPKNNRTAAKKKKYPAK